MSNNKQVHQDHQVQLYWEQYEQAQRRAAAGRSRHKSHGVIQ